MHGVCNSINTSPCVEKDEHFTRLLTKGEWNLELKRICHFASLSDLLVITDQPKHKTSSAIFNTSPCLFVQKIIKSLIYFSVVDAWDCRAWLENNLVLHIVRDCFQPSVHSSVYQKCGCSSSFWTRLKQFTIACQH